MAEVGMAYGSVELFLSPPAEERVVDGSDNAARAEWTLGGVDLTSDLMGQAQISDLTGSFPKTMRHKSTNMLSRFLHVCHPIAKQALIIAIDFLGNVILSSAESGAPFALKGRDQQFDYILILMEHVHYGFVDYDELLSTKAFAISACTTLVSVEPKLTVETRNNVMKATLGSSRYKMTQLKLSTPS